MSYNVVLDGTILPGFDQGEVTRQLARMTGQSEAVAGSLLAGRMRRVKSGVEEHVGQRYVDALRAIGVSSRIEPILLPLDDVAPSTTSSESGALPDPSIRRKAGPTEKYCSACSSIVHRDAEICPKCGVRLHGSPQSFQAAVQVVTVAKSRTIAAMLAFFLGGLGIHKFYLGMGSGIWYLLFCWTLVPAFIGFFEGLSYLMMSNDSFNHRFNGAAIQSKAVHKLPSSARRAWIGLGLLVLIVAAVLAMFHQESRTSKSEEIAQKSNTTPVAAAVPADIPNPPECQNLKYELADDVIAANNRPIAVHAVGPNDQIVEWHYPKCILTLKRETINGASVFRVSDTRAARPAPPTREAATTKPVNTRIPCEMVITKREGENFILRAERREQAIKAGYCQ